MIIKGVDMPNFSIKEIPQHVSPYMSRLILSRIQIYRNLLECPFNISMAHGALIRFDGSKTSEHYVIKTTTGQIEKLSRAIDGFPDCDIFKAWTITLSSGMFTGVGVYFDTRNNHGVPQPMLHLDLRSTPLIWYRNGGEYFYPHNKNFFKNLNCLLSTSELIK